MSCDVMEPWDLRVHCCVDGTRATGESLVSASYLVVTGKDTERLSCDQRVTETLFRTMPLFTSLPRHLGLFQQN
jgi:hypothetical protein